MTTFHSASHIGIFAVCESGRLFSPFCFFMYGDNSMAEQDIAMSKPHVDPSLFGGYQVSFYPKRFMNFSLSQRLNFKLRLDHMFSRKK